MKHSNSRRRETTKKRYGKKFFAEIGSIGGANNHTKFTSETGRIAANTRWIEYRRKQLIKKSLTSKQKCASIDTVI